MCGPGKLLAERTAMKGVNIINVDNSNMGMVNSPGPSSSTIVVAQPLANNNNAGGAQMININHK